ncbi:MAG: alpha/beta fold hydrolase [Xanthobacteraceae bacterium]
MSLWTDFLGAETRYVSTPGFGRTRIVEAGARDAEALILMHGIGGHLEAYARNVVALADRYHVVAFDFVGHGFSEKRLDVDYTPESYAEHLRELMDALGIDRAHISGESLGGWVAGKFALRYPDRVMSLVLNTSAGLPIVSDKGRQDLANLVELSKKSAGQPATFESVLARMKWLLHPSNWGLLTEELVGTRLRIYTDPDAQKAAPLVQRQLARNDPDDLVAFERLSVNTLFLWTRDNPVHDLAAAEAACARTPRAQLYVMDADAAHWPQYEAPEEFNSVLRKFFSTGECRDRRAVTATASV